MRASHINPVASQTVPLGHRLVHTKKMRQCDIISAMSVYSLNKPLTEALLGFLCVVGVCFILTEVQDFPYDLKSFARRKSQIITISCIIAICLCLAGPQSPSAAPTRSAHNVRGMTVDVKEQRWVGRAKREACPSFAKDRAFAMLRYTLAEL